MKYTGTLQKHSLLTAALFASGLGITGIGIAADYPATTNAPSPTATKPATDTTTSSTTPQAGAAIAPSKSEMPDSAFKKLDSGGKGYVTMEDAKAIPDFAKIFPQYDANHDGRLTMAEFKSAWLAFAGKEG
jgi:hypothetical protein